MTHLKLRLLACAFTVWFVQQPLPAHAQPQPAATQPAPSAETRLPHISIVTQGKGSPVVLIPGLSSPRAVWNGTAAALARSHQVILVQVNGFAGDDPGANLQPGLLDGAIADLHGYLVKHRIAAAPVIGHSLGGLLTLLLAKAHPGDVGRAMVVDSLPYVGEIFVPGATVAQLEPQARAMRDQLSASYGKGPNTAYIDRTAEQLAAKPASQAAVKAWMRAADPRVTGGALYEDMTTDLRPDMATIATPLTVIVPFNATLPEERARAVYTGAYAKAPHAQIVTIGDSEHFVMLDQPAAFQATVDHFLAR